jgi:two-component system, OmpR family, KDP operon response regulator KdpE
MSGAPGHKTIVLVIDDEVQMRRLLRTCLERSGYEVAEAASGEDGLWEATRCQPSAVLLDLALPDMDGLAVLKRIREWSQVPILIISVRGDEEEKVALLDNGANDYVTKPFSTAELLARLRALQRYAQPAKKPEIFRSGILQVDLVTRTVKVQGRKVKLTATEYALLRLFVQHAGKVLTHGQIMREIWGSEEDGRISHLRVYIAYLRSELEANPAEPELIVTEPGVGYRLTVIENERD